MPSNHRNNYYKTNKAKYFDPYEQYIARNENNYYSQKRVNKAKSHMAGARKSMYKSPMKQRGFATLQKAWRRKRDLRHIEALYAAERWAQAQKQRKMAVARFARGMKK